MRIPFYEGEPRTSPGVELSRGGAACFDLNREVRRTTHGARGSTVHVEPDYGASRMLKAGASVEQLQAAIRVWGVGMYEWDHDDERVTGTSRFLELYGWSGSTCPNAEALWASVHPDDRGRTRAAFARALDPMATGSVDLIHRVVHSDGRRLWLHLRAQTHFDTVGGQRQACVTTGSVVDVTERKKIEQELRRTEGRFEEAVRSAQFGIFEHNHIEDPDAEQVYWSPRLREIFGVAQDEPASAATLLSRVHPDDHDGLHRAVVRAHDPEGDGYYDVEHRYLHPRRGTRWLMTRSSTHFGEVGGKRVPVRTVGAMLDVTARRKSEQEHEQRAQILDATIDFVAIVRLDGCLVYLNRAGREFIGIGSDDILSERSIGQAHPPESLHRVLTEGMPAAARDGVWQSETEFLRHDGMIVPMSQVLLFHAGRDGEPGLYSTIARDISRERQLEENMRQSQKMEAVGRLAGGIAHDFNNILSVVLSFAYVAAEKVGASGKGYSEMQQIMAAGKRAAALTQQLLAFSRKQVLRPRVVDVVDVLTRMSPMIERLVGEHINVVLSLAEPPLRVKVDPTHLEQVLLNLAINARDAMEEGGCLGIGARLVQIPEAPAVSHVDLEPGSYAVIAVSDTGVGMNAEAKAHVFEPFFTTKEVGQGTGLGLATVFGIVKQSGGSMSVGSEEGRGSIFEAYFPSSNEPLGLLSELPTPHLKSRGEVVLVAEDDSSLRQVVVTVLERAGYRVMQAKGPLEALALAQDYPGPIDLLLTDVVMPQLSGKQLAERLTALRPGLPVLYMSGYTDKDIVHRGVLEEGVSLLHKPLTPPRLLAMVAQALIR